MLVRAEPANSRRLIFSARWLLNGIDNENPFKPATRLPRSSTKV